MFSLSLSAILTRERTGNYANMLGFSGNHDLTEYLRLYISIHGDHEGGNASAHATRKARSLALCGCTAHVDDQTDLVASTLADPYLAYSAGLYALAGPLHG